jgi:hypothetical protein
MPIVLGLFFAALLASHVIPTAKELLYPVQTTALSAHEILFGHTEFDIHVDKGSVKFNMHSQSDQRKVFMREHRTKVQPVRTPFFIYPRKHTKLYLNYRFVDQ